MKRENNTKEGKTHKVNLNTKENILLRELTPQKEGNKERWTFLKVHTYGNEKSDDRAEREKKRLWMKKSRRRREKEMKGRFCNYEQICSANMMMGWITVKHTKRKKIELKNRTKGENSTNGVVIF